MRSALLSVGLLLLVALLGGCGGGGDEGSTAAGASAETQSAPQPTAKAPKGSGQKQKPKQSRNSSQSSAAKHVNAAPLKVSAGGSGQFKVKGGDNSVQEYGEEAGESELREAAEAVHSFYVARAGEEWRRACTYVSSAQLEALKQLATRAAQLKGKGCAALLAALTEPLSASLQRRATTVDAAALRHEGEQAFLVYTGPPGQTVYSMPLNLEGGAWKVGALSGSVLPGT